MNMRIITTIQEMQAFSRKLKAKGKTIGFVPTMGALHEGHLSLVRQSRRENDATVVSIFVNPTQFGPDEDLDRYPRDTEGDLNKLSSLDIDAVFMPRVGEMYPEGFSLMIDAGSIGRILCGKSRPGHFSGVATVVAKLFNSVMPDRAYFGQKDLQQTVLIKKLVREMNFDIIVVVCPIIREPDGLAMSSRNNYLSYGEKQAAGILFRALELGEELIKDRGFSSADSVKNEMAHLINSESLAAIDYIDIVDAEDLGPVENITGSVALCLAVNIGNIRLIDNIIVDSG
jgi:pantoate--beta-alanine ligase